MIRIASVLTVIACSHPSAPPSPAPPPSSALPASLISHMQAHGWGQMHLQWHTERRWDRLPATAAAYAQRQGWTRAARQEGESGNGVEFLAMHRVMLQMLADLDPAARPWLVGWSAPPTDPKDAADPIPNGATTPFSPDMLAALDRLEHHLDSFASEDELGLYIETSFRPQAGDPMASAADRTAGVHNYLHQRFQDPSSPTDLGNPAVNLLNARFWRLHGWIDHLWATYRAHTGQRDTDPTYQATMQAAKAAMSMHMKAIPEPPPAELIDAVRP